MTESPRKARLEKSGLVTFTGRRKFTESDLLTIEAEAVREGFRLIGWSVRDSLGKHTHVGSLADFSHEVLWHTLAGFHFQGFIPPGLESDSPGKVTLFESGSFYFLEWSAFAEEWEHAERAARRIEQAILALPLYGETDPANQEPRVLNSEPTGPASSDEAPPVLPAVAENSVANEAHPTETVAAGRTIPSLATLLNPQTLPGQVFAGCLVGLILAVAGRIAGLF
jgi:hypothetical protein